MGKVTWLRPTFLRDLTRKGQADLVGNILSQIDATLEAASLVDGVVSGNQDFETIRARVRFIEEAGGGARSELVMALSSAFSTPIDREDLFRLSRSIDDVLDNLRDFLREVRLFAPDDPLSCGPLVSPVHEGLRHLREAVLSLGHDGSSVEASTAAARRAGTAIRREYEDAVAELFRRPISSEILKQREILRRLDVVGLRLSEATDVLADGWLKRGK